jgi:hypothetical protein
MISKEFWIHRPRFESRVYVYAKDPRTIKIRRWNYRAYATNECYRSFRKVTGIEIKEGTVVKVKMKIVGKPAELRHEP